MRVADPAERAKRVGWWLALLLIAALAVTWSNRALPLVRNSLVYARASENVIASDFDPRSVVADSSLSYDKPILYAWVSAPFVRALGTHDGLRVTSFMGTAAFLAAAWFFARSFRARLGVGDEALELWLCALGPAVFYQFWSAHPDGAFAALVVVAWGLCERLVVDPGRRVGLRVGSLGVVVLLAILLKNYGLVLLISCPLYLWTHRRELRVDAAASRRLWTSAGIVFASIAAFSLSAWLGHNPLSRLEGEGGGVGQYANGELWLSARGTWVQLGLALAVHFHVALSFAFRRAAWTRGLLAPALCFAAPYVAGLMPFPTTFYNMRYFLPLFPFAALMLARGAASWPLATRRVMLGVHALLAVALIVVFNDASVYRRVEPALPKLEVNWIGVPLSLLDNLRMPLHLAQARTLEAIDRHVPAGATLYLLDVDYYRDAQQGVFERDGRIRADITTRYASSRDFHPTESSYYLLARRPLSDAGLAALGEAEELDGRLYRVRTTR